MISMQIDWSGMASVLIDTNLLVYVYDQNAPVKQRRAIEVLERVRSDHTGVITAQVLSEFYAVATRKLSPPLTPAQAEAQLQIFSLQWPVFPVTEAVVLLAARGAQKHQIHFWDAQIWAAARLHGITLVYSENFNSGAVIKGVRLVNPLTETGYL